MRSFRFLVLLMAALPLTAMQATQQPSKWSVWHLVHPDTKLLIGLDWRQAQQSPLGPMLKKQVAEGGHPLLNFLESIENVDRLLVSSTGAAPGGRRPPLLVIAQGHFQLSKIRTLATSDGAVSRRYNDVELLVPGGGAANEEIHFALIDASTILFGDGVSIKAAINRHLRQEPPNNRNLAVARSMTLSTANDFWMVSEEPFQALNNLGIGTMPFMEMLTGLEMNVTMRDGLNVQLSLFAKTAEDAQQLMNGISPLLQLMAIQPQANLGIQELARRCHITLDRGIVRLTADLERKLVDQALQTMRATRSQQVTQGPAPGTRLTTPLQGALQQAGQSGPQAQSGPPPGAAAVTTSSRKVIRIVGMEEGIREIPYNNPPD
jgi:hypothetical protein